MHAIVRNIAPVKAALVLQVALELLVDVLHDRLEAAHSTGSGGSALQLLREVALVRAHHRPAYGASATPCGPRVCNI